MTSPLRSRFTQAKDGIAAVEFGLLAPVFIGFLGVLIDLGIAFNTQLRLAGAVHAASQVAFATGQTLDPAATAKFLAKVSHVATQAAGSTPVTVRVLFNNVADESRAWTFYCVSGDDDPVWTSTGTSAASCGEALTSGKYVTISVSATRRYLFLPAVFAARIATLSDTAIVRVQ